MAAPPDAVERILDLYRDAGRRDYFGEPVTQLEHALQCAACALAEGHRDAVVCAAFLHDVGHLCAGAGHPSMAGLGAQHHETVGAEFLSKLGFGEPVVGLVRSHVDAKRYLVWKRPDYAARMSDASRATLRHQGGAMSAVEARRFEALPAFSLALELRTWDDIAKRPGAATPPLEDIARRLAAAIGRAAPVSRPRV